MDKLYQSGLWRTLEQIIARFSHHFCEDSRKDMSIDDILAATRKYVSAHERFSELKEGLNVS